MPENATATGAAFDGTTIRVNRATHKKLKLLSVEIETNISDTIEFLLNHYHSTITANGGIRRS